MTKDAIEFALEDIEDSLSFLKDYAEGVGRAAKHAIKSERILWYACQQKTHKLISALEEEHKRLIKLLTQCENDV